MRAVMAMVTEQVTFEKSPYGSLVNVFVNGENVDCFTNYQLEDGGWDSYEKACQEYLEEMKEETA